MKEKKYVRDSRVEKYETPPDTTPNDYSEYPGKTESFWPNFLLKEWIVGAVFLIGFLAFVTVRAAPLESIADPTNTSYIPLPDWYFLFLYQLLKYTYAAGPYMIIGTAIIPTIAIGALILVPFLDRRPERNYKKRIFPLTFMLLGVATIFFLTWDSARHEDWEMIAKQGQISMINIDKESPGYKIYSDNGCVNCHGDALQGGVGPSLQSISRSESEIANIARNGVGNMPSGIFKGSDEELQTLVGFINENKK